MNFNAALDPIFYLQRARAVGARGICRPAVPSVSYDRFLVDVDFERPDGARFSSVGGGATLEDAIAAARSALPGELPWAVARWSHVYGE